MRPSVFPRFLQAMRTYKLPGAEVRKLQERKLRKTLQDAFTSVPYYRRLFRSRGWTPDDFGTVDALEKFPLLTREDVARNFPDGLQARGLEPALVRVTSGTTGGPVRVAFSSEFLDTKAALMMRRFMNFGIRPWHRMVTIWDPPWRWRRVEGEDGQRRPTTQLKEMPFAAVLGRPIPQIKVLQGGTMSLREEAKALSRLEPDFIFCRPTHLRRIAISLADQGLEVRPKALICSNELLTDTCSEELESSFRAKTLRLFGGSEGGPMGEDCAHKTGIHLNEDHYVIEILKDGVRAGPGETGEVVVTHLHNPVMPLIRYPMGDLAKVGDEGKCECGSSLPRVESIVGRASDFLVTAKGDSLAPLPIADHLEREFGLRDFQVVQAQRNGFILRTSEGDTVSQEMVQGIRDYLSDLVGCSVSLTLEDRRVEEKWMKERPVTRLAG